MKKSKQRLRDLWDTKKWTNRCIVGALEGKQNGAKRLSEEIMAEKFPNFNERCDSTNPSSSTNHKEDKRRDPHPDTL